jgi:hypothetical protein
MNRSEVRKLIIYKNKGKNFPSDLLYNFVFVIGIPQYMTNWTSGYREAILFPMKWETKLRVWKLQLQSNSVTHFRLLRVESSIDAEKYAEEIQLL